MILNCECCPRDTVPLVTLYWEASTLNTSVVEDRSLVVFSFQVDFQSNWCFSINCGHNCLRAWFYCWLPPFSLILDLFDEDKLKPLVVVIWNLFFHLFFLKPIHRHLGPNLFQGKEGYFDHPSKLRLLLLFLVEILPDITILTKWCSVVEILENFFHILCLTVCVLTTIIGGRHGAVGE